MTNIEKLTEHYRRNPPQYVHITKANLGGAIIWRQEWNEVRNCSEEEAKEMLAMQSAPDEKDDLLW